MTETVDVESVGAAYLAAYADYLTRRAELDVARKAADTAWLKADEMMDELCALSLSDERTPTEIEQLSAVLIRLAQLKSAHPLEHWNPERNR